MDFIDWPNGYFSFNCEYFTKLCCFFDHRASLRQISRYRISVYGTKKSTPVLENNLKSFSIGIRHMPATVGMMIMY
jgi:hypothetical protein